MHKFFVLLFLGLIAIPSMTFSQVYGTLRGKVVDEEGKGLRGASVFVEGTQKGAAVRENDGSYVITGIVAGEYTVRFTFTGRTTVRKQVRISASLTATLDVTMRDASVRTEELVVVAQREIVNHTKQGSMDKRSNEDIINTAREGIGAVISLSAGVLQSGSGFSIRGGRADETDVRIDGISVGNAFTGGFGASGAAYFPMVSSFATEEVQVLKGGFSAEYGDVTSGVVNSVVQTGRDNKYDGWVRWRTDVPALFGSQSTGTRIERDGSRFRAVEVGEGAKWQGQNEHTFEFGTGGPLPLMAKGNTFYLTGRYFHEANRNASYEIYDPWGNNIGQRPDNGSWVRNLTGRLKFAIADGVSLTLGGSYGVSSFEFSGWAWLYANREGYVYDKNENGNYLLRTNEDGSPVTNGMEERLFKQNVLDNFVINYFALLTHTLSPTSFYEVRISQSTNNDYSSRRTSTDGPGFFSGWDMQTPSDNYMVMGNQLIPGKDKIVDQYTQLIENTFTSDGFLRLNLPQRNPLTGYYEGQANASGSYNPWGIPNVGFATSGSGGFSFRDGSNWTIDGSFNQYLKTGEFEHNFKAGFQGQILEMYKHSNSNPYDGNPFFDVFDDGRFGGNLYADNEVVRERTNRPYNPMKLGMYVQDQISYKGIIFSPGLRFDFFDPNAQYRVNQIPFVSIRADSGFADASVKMQVSPRVNVAYPITETSNIRLSYGMYFQMPMLQYLYDAFAVDIIRGASILGNPNMDAQRTNQYEIEYSLGLTDDLVFSATAFYKDEYNKVGIVYVPAVPDPYSQRDVTEYGTSRGFELNFRKTPLPTENYAFDINYNLGYLAGTASGPNSNYGLTIDPYTNLPAFPLSEYPMPNDIRHFFKGNFRFYWLDGQGPSIGGLKVLENSDIIITSTYRTGVPYTRTDRNGTPLSEVNSDRQPSFWGLDARIQRTIQLKSIFGESAGNTMIQLFVDVNNLLNRTVVTGVYATTSDPLDDGRTFDRQVGDFNSITYYKTPTYENPSTFASTQYDAYGDRLYNEMADFDGNGLVTQAEVFESYFRYIDKVISFRGNFQIPRTIFFGMMFRF
ncbi:MAG: TonB-dependent receptor [Candidatus Kapabacteria bacterium]|nr:TonB-dependent receptor [Ignavibacteriota bacterium]MCW5883905.1 TonB-dependent receptor [Candidatus Kapabacteria bacterium]